jgi:hypothetical protein
MAPLDEVYNRMMLLEHANSQSENGESKIPAVFQRIMVDPSKYEGKRLSDILLMVWNRIQINPHKEVLEHILLEEMNAMDGTCSTGYLARLLTTLAGFDDVYDVKISVRDEIKACVVARLSRTLEKFERNDKVLEGDKTSIQEFKVCAEPIIDKLLSEYPSHIGLVKEAVENWLYPIVGDDETLDDF